MENKNNKFVVYKSRILDYVKRGLRAKTEIGQGYMTKVFYKDRVIDCDVEIYIHLCQLGFLKVDFVDMIHANHVVMSYDLSYEMGLTESDLYDKALSNKIIDFVSTRIAGVQVANSDL